MFYMVLASESSPTTAELEDYDNMLKKCVYKNYLGTVSLKAPLAKPDGELRHIFFYGH